MMLELAENQRILELHTRNLGFPCHTIIIIIMNPFLVVV